MRHFSSHRYAAGTATIDTAATPDFPALPGIYLEDLFVQPQFRGRGIGKALLIHLARMVCDRGWGRLDWSVLGWNKPAINFYRSIGARAMSDWTQFRLDGDALAAVA